MNAMLARAATVSLIALFGTLLVVAVAAIGILGIRSATYQGNVIAGGELDTAVATNQLAREIDAAYATGEAALRTADPATRSRLLGTLDTSLLPAIDAQLFSLEQLHAGDPPAELRRPGCSSGSGRRPRSAQRAGPDRPAARGARRRSRPG
jgi:hypothetical protein